MQATACLHTSFREHYPGHRLAVLYLLVWRLGGGGRGEGGRGTVHIFRPVIDSVTLLTFISRFCSTLSGTEGFSSPNNSEESIATPVMDAVVVFFHVPVPYGLIQGGK